MLKREVAVSQRLFHTVLDLLSYFLQIHGTQLFHHSFVIFSGCLLVQPTNCARRYLAAPQGLCNVFSPSHGYACQTHLKESFFHVAFTTVVSFNDCGHNDRCGNPGMLHCVRNQRLESAFQLLLPAFSFRVSSTLLRTNSFSSPLITSSFSCTILSDMVCVRLSEWCVVTSF